jgi:hypothetical protein
MPEKETPVDVRWLIGIAGCASEVPVTAAYVQQQIGLDGIKDFTLKDANHKIVFQGPREHVLYVRRRPDPGGIVPAVYVTSPPGLTPGQMRDLQDALDDVAGSFPGKVIIVPSGSKVPPDGEDELTRQIREGVAPIDEARARLAKHPWEIGEG